jgi:hypothetical protein
MSEKKEEETFFESICYDCCWYFAKIYTYIQTYVCCWFCKKKSNEVDETTSIIHSNNSNSNTYNYKFLVVEIKANNKTYVLEDHNKIMLENKEFLKPQFVYDYLVSKKYIKNNNSINKSNIIKYTINIIDDKGNFISLDNDSYLLLKKNNYKKIVMSIV